MKLTFTNIVLFLIISIFGYACTAKYGNEHNTVNTTLINGYSPKRKPLKTEAYILNKTNFNNYFKPIKVVLDNNAKIDFRHKLAGALILPETQYDTRIILNKAFVEDSILHIQYSIHQVLEKRSYKMIPSRLFTFDADIPVKYAAFEYGETIIKKPIK